MSTGRRPATSSCSDSESSAALPSMSAVSAHNSTYTTIKIPTHLRLYISYITYIHTYMHTYIHTYSESVRYWTYCLQTSLHTHKHTVHTPKVFNHGYIGVDLWPLNVSIGYIHTYIHAYIHSYIHMYIHTFIHTYVHTNMIPTDFKSFFLFRR